MQVLRLESTADLIRFAIKQHNAPKRAIVAFVERVTKEDSPDFVPVPERIATFDNDGTLWVEQAMYVQVIFLIERVRALAPQHPEWKTKEPFASLLKGDMEGVAATGETGAIEMMVATHTGMTTEEFTGTVSDWIATAKHPKTGSSTRSGLSADARAARLPARECLQDLHRPPAAGRASRSSCTTTMGSGSGRTTGSRTSAGSTRPGTRRMQGAGRSSA
jgi:haloacid dehalogenase-like hydrolase